jgi:hypothetical protein
MHFMCTLLPQHLQKETGNFLDRNSSWQIGQTSDSVIGRCSISFDPFDVSLDAGFLRFQFV